MDRSQRIKQALAGLEPVQLTLIDESADHIGHSGAEEGAGHFALSITSHQFEGKTPVKRHQMVYEALGDLMKFEIHAIRIDAKTPNEG